MSSPEQALGAKDSHYVPCDPEVVEAFYASVLGRIHWLMPVLSVIGTAVAWLRAGCAVAVGFALGCTVAYINFQWLAHLAHTLGERVVCTRAGENGFAVVALFLMRYALLAFAGYVVSRFSLHGFYGMMAGWFLPTVAILCEAAFEISGGRVIDSLSG